MWCALGLNVAAAAGPLSSTAPQTYEEAVRATRARLGDGPVSSPFTGLARYCILELEIVLLVVHKGALK